MHPRATTAWGSRPGWRSRLGPDEPANHHDVAPPRGIVPASDCFTLPGVDPIIEEVIRRVRPPALVWLIQGAATPANGYELTRRVYDVAGPWAMPAVVDPHHHPLTGFGFPPAHQLQRLRRDDPPPPAEVAIHRLVAPLESFTQVTSLLQVAAQNLTPREISVGIQAPLPRAAPVPPADSERQRLTVITSQGQTLGQLLNAYARMPAYAVRPAPRSAPYALVSHVLLLWFTCSADLPTIATP